MDLYHVLQKQCLKTTQQDDNWCHAITKQLLKQITTCGGDPDYSDKDGKQVENRLVDCSNMAWHLRRECRQTGGGSEFCTLSVIKTMDSFTACKKIKADHDKLFEQ